MSLSHDLMEQADHLARREPRRPRQASLRRSVSAAYYGLFHLLSEAAADTLAPNVPQEINHRVRRWLDHGEMKRICGRFLQTTLSRPLNELVGQVASSEMQLVASAFIQLQDARHSADYDLNWYVSREEALQFIGVARDAFDAWRQIHDSSEANIFLLSLLLWKNWEKERV